MDAVERVLKTINHEEPDRVPAFESIITSSTLMIHYGVIKAPKKPPTTKKSTPIKTKGTPFEIWKKIWENKNVIKAGAKNLYELYRRAGIEIVPSMATGFTRFTLADGRTVNEYGKIFQRELYEKDGTPINGYVGGYIKSFEDYESWEKPDPHWEARLTNFKACRELQEEMNNEIFSVPATGALMEVSWEGFGLETFSRILRKHKQAKTVFDDRGKFALELVKILAENDAKMVILWDDYGFKNGLFMPPKNYRTYVFPWIKQICKAAHERNCKVLLHSDGDLLEIFDDIVKCGIDVINPIESTTANPNYNIFKLHEKYGDKITFAGNLSPIMLAMGDISEIEAYAKKLIRELAPNGGYIFGSGHSINPAVTVDRFEAMQNIRRKHGNYPINVPD